MAATQVEASPCPVTARQPIERLRDRRSVVEDDGDVAHLGGDPAYRRANSGFSVTRTASSKSRAVSPSMVTIGSARKSRRLRNFLFVELGHGAGLGKDVIRKDVRQLVLADHHLHVDTEVVRRAQHFDHPAHRRPRGRWPAGNLHIDDQAFEVVVGLQRRLRCPERDGAWRFLRPGAVPGLQGSESAASCARRRERRCARRAL